MRVVIAVIVILLATIFFCGSVNLGGNSIFGHIDTALGTNVFMKVHYLTYWFLYRSRQTVESEIDDTSKKIDNFSERPAGIDKKKYYRKLDEASQY